MKILARKPGISMPGLRAKIFIKGTVGRTNMRDQHVVLQYEP